MSKQDRQGVRTPADVERKYNFGKAFSEVMGAARDAGAVAEDAQAVALKVLKLQDSMEVSITTLEGQYSNLEISTKGISSEVSQQSGDIEELNRQVTSVSQTAEGLKVSVTNISTDLNGKADKEDVQQITEHFVFGEEGMTISNSASGMGIDVSEKQVAFTGGENPSTVIRPNSMNTTNLTVMESLTLGDFAFIPRTNGNLSFRYTGGSG